MTRSQPVIVPILGMHRSGTSCLAGTLESRGLYLGDDGHQASPFNPRGNREYRPLVIFQENVLRHLGGCWSDPPARVHWAPRHRQRARELLEALCQRTPCGFKDPRTLLHWHEWRSLPFQWRPVGIFRHPEACARSLMHRDGLSHDSALTLWHHYNQSLLAALADTPFPLINFDWPAPTLLRVCTRVAGDLGLNTDPALPAFFEDVLRRPAPDTPLSPKIQAVYDALREAAASSDDAAPA